MSRDNIRVREARAGDGRGCAQAWSDAGRYLHDIDPDIGQVPEQAGLAEHFETACSAPRSPDEVWLVAERNGQVAGFVQGYLAAPSQDAFRQIQRDLASVRLVIDALAVVEDERRAGVGTELMKAIEDIGRVRGAVVATLDTNLRSYLSVPFYEERMGYLRQAVVFRKRL